MKNVKPTEENSSRIIDIVEQYPKDRQSLIPILQDIQERFGYLSEQAVDRLGEMIDVSANEIYGVATFYTQFRFNPPGEHNVRVCQGTACHVRGGHQILREFQHRLGIHAGQTTADGKFDLERVACVGCCALAPVVTVDGKVHAQVTAKKIPALLSQYMDNKDTAKT
jgi:NADH-quinone oxidoreductase subunit E